MTRIFLARVVALATAFLFLQGCFAVADLNSYEVAEGAACDDETQFRDLNVDLLNMSPHIGQWFEVRVMSPDDFLRARAIINPMKDPDESFFMREAVPPGEHFIDLFADLDQSGTYTPPDADHAWREDVCDMVNYEHNTVFFDIPVPRDAHGNFIMHFSGMAPNLGQRFELKVTEDESNRTTGLYLIPELTTDAFDVEIAGIMDNGTTYRIEFYADVSGNGQYDAPPVDEAWRVIVLAGATGIEVDFPENEDGEVPPGDVDIGF